jgi:hypothetical protein
MFIAALSSFGPSSSVYFLACPASCFISQWLSQGMSAGNPKQCLNLRKKQNHSASLYYSGWTARPSPWRLPVAGEAFLLTSPLQKLLHVCAGVIRKPSLLAFFFKELDVLSAVSVLIVLSALVHV